MLKINLARYLSAALFYFFVSIVYADNTDALLRHAHDPLAGNPNGKVTIVEFFDYQCSHCVAMINVINNVIKTNPNVRFVFKELPIKGDVSELAAKAALAANKQGKYYPFSHVLLSHSRNISMASILGLAQANGLNVSKLKKDMESPEIASQLQENFKLADHLNVTGTPSFFISKSNNTNIRNVNQVFGKMSQQELQAEINKAAR